MIYVVDNISNYFIYLFIIHFGFRLNPRKNKFYIGASVLTMLSAGAYNAYFDTNSPIIYIPDSRKRDDEFSPHLAELPEFY